MNAALHAVVDASALLAYLHEETGADHVSEVLEAGAAMSVINWAEVLTKLAELGKAPERTEAKLKAQGLVGGLLTLYPVVEEDAVPIAELRALTKPAGLSLGDRVCLALGLRLALPVVTADRSWGKLDLRLPVQLIR